MYIACKIWKFALFFEQTFYIDEYFQEAIPEFKWILWSWSVCTDAIYNL